MVIYKLVLLKRIAIAVLMLACSGAGCFAQIASEGRHQDLVSALESVSIKYHVPVLAELTASYPEHIVAPENARSLKDALEQIARQATGYSWSIKNGIVLFNKSRLFQARGNFFNRSIPYFVIPDNVAELTLELKGAMLAKSGTAPVMSGAPEQALQSAKLNKGKVLENMTGREILLEAARESNNLFSVILFSTANPKSRQEADTALINWYVRSIDELPTNPTRLRSIPEKKNQSRL